MASVSSLTLRSLLRSSANRERENTTFVFFFSFSFSRRTSKDHRAIGRKSLNVVRRFRMSCLTPKFGLRFLSRKERTVRRVTKCETREIKKRSFTFDFLFADDSMCPCRFRTDRRSHQSDQSNETSSSSRSSETSDIGQSSRDEEENSLRRWNAVVVVVARQRESGRNDDPFVRLDERTCFADR